MSLLEGKGIYFISNSVKKEVFIGYSTTSYLLSFLNHYKDLVENNKRVTYLSNLLLEEGTKFSVDGSFSSAVPEERVKEYREMYMEKGWKVHLPIEIHETKNLLKGYTIKKAYFNMLKHIVTYLKHSAHWNRHLEKLYNKIYGDPYLQSSASIYTRLEYETFSIDKFTLEEIQSILLDYYKRYLRTVTESYVLTV